MGPFNLYIGNEFDSMLILYFQYELADKKQDWAMSRCRHMYEVSSRRCRKIPVYGKDLIHVVKKITSHDPRFVGGAIIGFIFYLNMYCLEYVIIPIYKFCIGFY